MVSDELLGFCSASSGGGGGRGAPQHYPKSVGNRYEFFFFKVFVESYEEYLCFILNINMIKEVVVQNDSSFQKCEWFM